MSPSAEPANIPAEAVALVPAERLEDGEVVILAVKPSRWFVLLVSWPLVLAAAIAAGATYLAGEFWALAVNERMVALVCSAVACTRVTIACFQWLGRVYVLTNRRVMRFRGIFREDFFQCPLRDIRRIHLSATPMERVLGVATLLFQRQEQHLTGEAHWIHLSDPREVQRIVQETWARAR